VDCNILFPSLKSEIWRCLRCNQTDTVFSVLKAQLNSRCCYLVLLEATEEIMVETAFCGGLLKLGSGAALLPSFSFVLLVKSGTAELVTAGSYNLSICKPSV